MEPKFQPLDSPANRIDAVSDSTRRKIGLIALPLVALLLFVIYWWQPQPAPPRITRDALSVGLPLWYGSVARTDVDLASARIVDLDSDPRWHIGARTFGYGSSRYSAGWFRVASGATVEIYKARDEHRCVVLPRHSSAPFVVCSARPEALLNELRTQWAR